MKLKLFLMMFLTVLFMSCAEDGKDGADGADGEDSTSDTTTSSTVDATDTASASNISGKVQKGPCFKDGEVIIQPLDSTTMYQTGDHYIGFTKDNYGDYDIPAEVSELHAEVFFEGSCHNEVTGGEGVQRLDGIVKVTDDMKNINPLTKIRSIVARDLFRVGFGDIEESLIEAERLTLIFLNMPNMGVRFTQMNLEQSALHDAILALINSMILYGRSEAEQGDYIVTIATGIINNDTVLKAEIAATVNILPLIQIKNNLESRYLELGMNITAPPIWRLGAPDYYANLLERDPVIQISHNLELTGSCSFDQSTFNIFASPIIFEAGMLTSNYFVSDFPADAQVSIWTKSADAYPLPETKLQDFTALKEVIIEPVMSYNGMIDSNNMPVVGEHYYLLIRKDEDFVLSKNCGAGPVLPFGQILASDDEMVSWIGLNVTEFFTRDIKYFTVN